MRDVIFGSDGFDCMSTSLSLASFAASIGKWGHRHIFLNDFRWTQELFKVGEAFPIAFRKVHLHSVGSFYHDDMSMFFGDDNDMITY